jgi:hypothetical protein
MKRILILAYEFPPYISVAGLRPLSWAKYGKEFGVEFTVVTRQWSDKQGNILNYVSPSDNLEETIEIKDNYTVIKAPYIPSIANRMLLKYGEQKFRLLRMAITAFLEIFQYFLPIGTKRTLYLTAKKQMKLNDYDYILTTGEPFVLFHYSSKLSKEFDKPWFADYRDPWSKNIHNGKVLKTIFSFIEKKVISSATKVFTVSNFVAQSILETTGKQSIILANGYDPEVVNKVKDQEQNTNMLTLAHAGSIYNWNPYQVFLEGIAKYLEDNPSRKIEVRFYGLNQEQAILSCIQSHPALKDTVKILPKLTNEQLLSELKSCNIMLLFNYHSFMGTKIYDYLAVKRIILLCFGNDDQALKLKAKYYTTSEPKNLSNTLQKDLIERCDAGYTVQNRHDLSSILKQLDDEFLEKGKIEWKGKNIQQFSRKNQVKHLCEHLVNT